MFAPRYFGVRHYAPRYYAPGADVEADRRVGGDDAPLRPIDEEWVKKPWKFGEDRAKAYEQALEAVEEASEEPSAESVDVAAAAVRRVTDPYAAPIKPTNAKKPNLQRLERASNELASIRAAYEAYKAAQREEEEAIIALLMVI